MRVHPDLLGSKPKWQLPAVLGLLASTIFVSGLLSDGNSRAVATQSNRISTLEVVTVRNSLVAGQIIQPDDVMLEIRPIETVPEGAFTKVEDLIGKRAGVPLRAGSLIAKLSLAADAPPETAAQQPEAPPRPTPKPPPLAAVPPTAQQVTPAMTAQQTQVHTPPASSVAAKRNLKPLKQPIGDVPTSHVSAAETSQQADIESGHEPKQNSAAVQPAAPSAPSTKPDESVKNASISATTPASVEQTIPDRAAKSTMPVEPAKGVPQPTDSPKKAVRRKFRSYAWVAGSPVTYGVNKSGAIEVIDRNGTVSPLDDYEDEE
ncbi:MAG: SAF domain-containing protein [Bdellovibrionota bacterium]